MPGTLTGNQTTLLILSPIGVPLYSARGLHQTLVPIDSAKNFRRTVNGGLVSLAPSQFQKYRSEIRCSDLDTPAIDGVWPGTVVTVSCVAELPYPTSGGSPARPVVANSTRVDTDSGFTFYRPILSMLVTDLEIDRDEWGDQLGWHMVLEEQ